MCMILLLRVYLGIWASMLFAPPAPAAMPAIGRMRKCLDMSINCLLLLCFQFIFVLIVVLIMLVSLFLCLDVSTTGFGPSVRHCSLQTAPRTKKRVAPLILPAESNQTWEWEDMYSQSVDDEKHVRHAWNIHPERTAPSSEHVHDSCHPMNLPSSPPYHTYLVTLAWCWHVVVCMYLFHHVGSKCAQSWNNWVALLVWHYLSSIGLMSTCCRPEPLVAFPLVAFPLVALNNNNANKT